MAYLATDSIHLTLLVSGQTDVLHGVGQPLAHHLLHPHRIPTVDEAIQTHNGNLLEHEGVKVGMVL